MSSSVSTSATDIAVSSTKGSPVSYKHFNFLFEDVLRTKEGMRLFEEHCKKELNHEGLDFLQHVERYHEEIKKYLKEDKETNTTTTTPNATTTTNAITFTKKKCQQYFIEDVEKIDKFAREIIETFVKPKSPKEINISAEIRSDILKRHESALSDPHNIFPVLFQRAYANMKILLNGDVFPRFLRSSLFINYVTNHCKSREMVEKLLGGTHLSKLPSNTLTTEHMKRVENTLGDFRLGIEIGKDFYNWKLVHSVPKENFAVYMGEKANVDQDVSKKYGVFNMAKVVAYLKGLNVHEVMMIFNSDPYSKSIYPSLNLPQKLPCSNVDSKNSAGYIVQEIMKQGGLVSPREYIVSASSIYCPNSKQYMLLFRSTEHDSFSKPLKGCIRGHLFSFFVLQEIDSTTVRLHQTIILNPKGWIEKMGNVVSIWKNWAIEIVKGANKAMDLYLKNKKDLHGSDSLSSSDWEDIVLNGKPLPKGVTDIWGFYHTMALNHKDGFNPIP